MRKFFLDLLNDLDKLCGLNQYIHLCALPKEQAKVEINKLLDILVQAADNFKSIPEDHKKRIISDAVMNDPEFKGFNAKIIYKWLIAKNHLYLNADGSEMKTEDKNYEPLTGEARLAALKEWQQALSKIVVPQPVASSGSKLRQSFEELPPARYKPPTAEELEMRAKISEIAAKKYKGMNVGGLKSFEVEGFVILAASGEEAQEIYIEAIGSI